MYQDKRETLAPIPPYDCKPFRNYPENPDWLYFFEEWKKIESSVGELPDLIPQIKWNTEARTQFNNERAQYLQKKNQANRNPLFHTDPVGVDANGKLWSSAGDPDAVHEVNGLTGKVIHLTPEDIGALPDTTIIPGEYKLPIATDTRLGGVRAEKKTEAMTQPVGVDDYGHLFAIPGGGGESYVLPQASADTLGGVKAVPKTDTMTEKVGIGIDGQLYSVPGSGGGGSYVLPQASADTLGGVRVAPKTPEMSQRVGIAEDGSLYVPVIAGPQGEPGIQGPQGEPGKNAIDLTIPQNLTAKQQSQARDNIQVIGIAEFESFFKAVNTRINHPVGSWWFSDDPTSPARLFGGTWERMADHWRRTG